MYEAWQLLALFHCLEHIHVLQHVLLQICLRQLFFCHIAVLSMLRSLVERRRTSLISLLQCMGPKRGIDFSSFCFLPVCTS